MFSIVYKGFALTLIVRIFHCWLLPSSVIFQVSTQRCVVQYFDTFQHINPFNLGKTEKLDFWDSQGSKGISFQWKTKKMLDFYWNYLKIDCLTSLGVLILFKPFSPGKTEKLDFWDSNDSTNFKYQ